MKIKEALKILSNSEIEEPVQAEALGQIEKSIIVKLVVVFIVGVVLLILSTVFLANNMARFSSTGAITILLSLLIFTLFISLAFLGYHLIGNVQKSYLIKSYKFYDFIQFIILAIILILFAQTFFIKTADVSGSSMEPTLHDGDKVHLDKTFYGQGIFNGYFFIIFKQIISQLVMIITRGFHHTMTITI